MDARLCDDHLRLEKSHWWHLAQRATLRHLLDGITLAANPLILDAGCGSGAYFALLGRFGSVLGMEPDEKMLAAARARASARVEQGALPANIPYDDIRFDLVALLNVLEYIKDDRAALAALHARMKNRGLLLLAVPANAWMHHNLDRECRRHRRYSRKALRAALESAGFHIEFMNHWNMLLFPLGLLLALLDRMNIGVYTLSLWPKSRTLNRLLARIAAAERHLMPHLPLPFGMTHIVIARKP